MMRLVRAGLMYGNLVAVDTEALVARYNRALEHLAGRRTELADFHIDISGFSPEIGDELGDDLYLNPNGCNRQFILLSTKQKSAPLLNASFSTSRDILRRFIEENESQLFALTARDAVAGELVNSIYSVKDAARLFKIHQIEVEADTTGNHMAEADDLMKKIETFRTRPDAWFDDALIGDMIELARSSGDIVRNPVTIGNTTFRQDNFYTSHFGGIYIFRDVIKPAAITVGPAEPLLPLPIETVYGFDDRAGIARFLEQNGLAESIVAAHGLDAGVLIRQRLDFILVDVAAEAGMDLGGMDRFDLRRVARRHADDMPPEFHALSDLLRWIEDGRDWPDIRPAHPAYFYTLRAAQTKDRDLVNMMLAELAPRDVRQLFICHKEAFYRAYRNWPEIKKSYVADFLKREYAVDKAGARAALFGPEPGMTTEPPPLPDPATRQKDLVRRVGPWGAVRRRN